MSNCPVGHKTINFASLKEHGQYILFWKNGQAVVRVTREEDFEGWLAYIVRGQIDRFKAGDEFLVPDGKGHWYEQSE